jgi:hypothetical protein
METEDNGGTATGMEMMDKRQRPYGRVYEIDADRVGEMRRRVQGAITQLSAWIASGESMKRELIRLRELLKDRDDDANTE